ncbi:MAG TPA: hypothetical protein VGK67_08960 [Myxococcales bacterium]|jgi:hypothetical protein
MRIVVPEEAGESSTSHSVPRLRPDSTPGPGHAPGPDPSGDRIKVRLNTTLLDRTGAVIASCDETENIRGGVRMDDVTVCPRAEMRTSEWPNVVSARITATIL